MPNQLNEDKIFNAVGVACEVYTYAIAKVLALYIVECHDLKWDVGEPKLNAESKRDWPRDSIDIRRKMFKLLKYAKANEINGRTERWKLMLRRL